MEQLRARLEPVVHVGLLQLRDGGAFDLIMGIAPQTWCAAVALPVVRNADAADEAKLAVDDQDLAMRPEINGRKMNEAKNLHVHTRAPEQADRAAPHAITPERILEEMHRHAGPRPFRQRLGKFVRDFAFAEEKIFERDRPFRGANRVEHSGEDFVPILQNGDSVPLEQRRPEHVSHRANERVVAGAIIRGDAIPDLLFRREKISRDEERGQAARSGGAEDFGPLRRLRTKRKFHCNSIEGGGRFDCHLRPKAR